MSDMREFFVMVYVGSLDYEHACYKAVRVERIAHAIDENAGSGYIKEIREYPTFNALVTRYYRTMLGGRPPHGLCEDAWRHVVTETIRIIRE